jgi:hypothetical protein
MTDRALRTIAALVGVLTVVAAVAGAYLRIVGPAAAQTFNIGSPLDFVAEAVAASTYGVVGTILAARLPRHPVPWIFLGIGASFAGVVLTWAYAVVGLSQSPELPLAREGVLLDTAVMQPVGLALLVALLVVFPDGRPFDRSGRAVLWLVPVTAALLGIGICLTPVDIGIFTGLRNPLNPSLPEGIGRFLTVAGVASTVALGAIAVRSMLRRYRAATDVQREQIRWLLWAGGLAVLLAGGVLVLIAVFPQILTTPAEAIVIVAFSAGAAVVPVACAVAIRRHRLYDIDRLISQTFVYTGLIAIVAGVYSALITGLQRLSVALTGEETDFSIVITTLVLAIAFEPVKKRLESFAERFRDDVAAPRMSMAVADLDDDELDALAARVAERVAAQLSARDSAPALSDTPSRNRAPDRATNDRPPSLLPESFASEPGPSERLSPERTRRGERPARPAQS